MEMEQYLVQDVLSTLMRHELKVYYQPKFDATTNHLKSAEALVRWVKEDGSIVLPEQFLPVMEQTDVITILDWYVVEEVCSFLERAQAEDIKIRPVFLNFSRWHLHEKNMVGRLAGIVDSHRLDHSFIVVEITESAMIDEENRMRGMVAELHQAGFEFSIDDFGSGLSSLSMVADTLPDEIKIDRSLLKKNCEDERERIILESIFLFATRLNMRTVAEEVETMEQLGFLRTCNCSLIQGFYFAKPMPEEQFRERLIAHGTASMHPDDQEEWNRTFCRENQLKLHRKGVKEFHLVTRQIGDDGIYRKVETSNYFVESSASEDILVISLCNNVE